MNGVLGGWQNPQVDHAGPSLVREHKATEIPIPREEYPLFLARRSQQINITRSGQSHRSGGSHSMTQPNQLINRYCIDILIGEKPHGIGATRISSTANTSIAY